MAWTAVSLLRHTITGEYSLVNYIINCKTDILNIVTNIPLTAYTAITSNGTITSHPLPGCLDSQGE